MSDDSPENWRSVVDSSTGRTYWYHRITRVSTWTKPACLNVIEDKSISITSSAITVANFTKSNENEIKQLPQQENLTVERAINLLHENQIEVDLILPYLLNRFDSLDFISKTICVYPHFINDLMLSLIKFPTKPNLECGLKILWFVSIPIESARYINVATLDKLTQVTVAHEFKLCVLYLSIALSFVRMSNTICITENTEKLIIDMFEKCLTDRIEVELDKIFAECNDSFSIFNVETILALTEGACRNHELSGVLVISIVKYLVYRKQRSYMIELLSIGGVNALLRLASCFTTTENTRNKVKLLLSDLISRSESFQTLILDKYIDIASNFESLGHLAKVVDPRTLHMGMNSPFRDKSEDYVDTLDQPILRDVEWKPLKGSPWRLCSSVMWSRCPGLRDLLDQFWDSGGGGLELNIDASSDTLNAICQYIHTGIYIPPFGISNKLEVIKVAIELRMSTLEKLSIEYVKDSLCSQDVDKIIEFSTLFEVNDLLLYCKSCKLIGRYGLTRNLDFGKVKSKYTPCIQKGDAELREAINQSLTEVDQLESMSSESLLAVNTSENSQSILVDSNSYEYSQLPKKSFSNNQSNKLKLKTSSTSIKPKSGGIYGLLLEDETILQNEPLSVPIIYKHRSDDILGNSKFQTSQSQLSKDAKRAISKSRIFNNVKAAHEKLSTIDVAEYNESMSLNNSMNKPVNRRLANNLKNSDQKAIVLSQEGQTVLNADVANSSQISSENVRSSLHLLKMKTKRATGMIVNSDHVNTGNNDYDSSGILKNEIDLPLDAVSIVTYPCPTCGREFNEKSLSRHSKVCETVFLKPRKLFESSKQRISADSVHSNFQQIKPLSRPTSNQSATPKWKVESEMFRKAMQAAKGKGEISNYTDPNLKQCPHCCRKFSTTAAERHIPICQSIRAKPVSLKRKSNKKNVTIN